MTTKRALPSQSLVREMLDYNEETGAFVWKRHRFQTVQASAKHVGRVAGTVGNGYLHIKIKGFFQVGAHRLAWIYVHGEIPKGMEIDHIDRNPLNNAIANLRLATRLQNSRNLTLRRNNRLGVRGVSLTRFGTYHARVAIFGREINLGFFSNLEDAIAARANGEKLYYGDFAGSVHP